MSLLRRISNLFSRSSMAREIEAELNSHIAMRIEDNLANGMSPEQARRDALLRFGNPIVTKENVAAADTALVFASIGADIRFACRQLWKNPGFACTAIAVLALGIGASVAIFAFVDAVLIKPLPYQHPSQLVGLFESTPMGPRYHLSYLDYRDWKSGNKSFTSLEAYDASPFALNTPTGIQRTDGATVSAGFFSTLGIAPILGRDLRPGEDAKGAARVVLLSYGSWQSRYGGRQDVLGRTVTLDNATYQVVGVLPPEFHFAPAGQAEFWTALHEDSNPDSRGEHGLSAIGRLKDGVSLQAAAEDMSSIAAQLARQYPDADGGRGAAVVALTEVISGNLRPILLLLLTGAVLLLLIACVNVSSLLLVRSESRRREIALRGALGATFGRLLQQFVIEGLALVMAGSVLGVSAAWAAMRLMTRLIPANMLADMPYLNGLGLDRHVLCFAGVIGLIAALLFTLIPVVRLSLSNLQAGLAKGGRAAAGTVWRHFGANLVVLELCTAMVLLSGAGLLGKSFYRLIHTSIGLQPDHLAVLRLRAPSSDYAKDPQVVALGHQLMDELGGLPGVQSVALAHQIPVANVAGGNTTFEIVGRPGHGAVNEANSREVSAGYFRTVQARLLRGRYFTEVEDATKPHVTIVNQAFARRYFAGEDPIGKRIQYDASQPPVEIVGMLDNIKEGPLDGEAHPALYIPFDQGPDNVFYIVARTKQSPEAMLKTLEEAVHRINPRILIFGAETMEGRIGHSQSTYLHRSSAWLVGGFAVIALFLGVVGLYGVIAYSVSQRTREIGVRIALGAQRSSVHRMVLREAGRLTATGILTGLVCSVIAAHVMRQLLFGTEPWDAGTLAAVAAVLAVSAMLASYIPARRAASIDPMEALRAE